MYDQTRLFLIFKLIFNIFSASDHELDFDEFEHDELDFDEYKSSEEEVKPDLKLCPSTLPSTFPKQEVLDSDFDFEDEYINPEKDEEFTVALYNKGNKKKEKKYVNPVECLVCHKLLKNKKTLRSHKLTHTNIRPFTCEICNHAFKLNSFLMTHKKRHFIPGPFSCELCKCFFKKKYKLDSHNEMMH